MSARLSRCPVCAGSDLPDDVTTVSKDENRVVLQGQIKAIIRPHEAHYPPFSNYHTVTLYPIKRKEQVTYLKFRTPDEVNKWGFFSEAKIRCEGCLHIADKKRLLFDITTAEPLK